jgi:hypothetical protein
MPVCGYDPIMGVGIGNFAEGLARSMRARAQRLDLSMAGQLAEEKDELFILAHVLQREIAIRSESSHDRRRVEAFLAIVLLARFLMGLDDEKPETREAFDQRLQRNAAELDNIMMYFEAEFEAQPRQNATLERVLHTAQVVLLDQSSPVAPVKGKPRLAAGE